MNEPLVQDQKPVQCPHCHGESIRFGRVGCGEGSPVFIPANRWMWIGYRAKGFVCLDCGYLGHFLSADDLQDIKDKDSR